MHGARSGWRRIQFMLAFKPEAIEEAMVRSQCGTLVPSHSIQHIKTAQTYRLSTIYTQSRTQSTLIQRFRAVFNRINPFRVQAQNVTASPTCVHRNFVSTHTWDLRTSPTTHVVIVAPHRNVLGRTLRTVAECSNPVTSVEVATPTHTQKRKRDTSPHVSTLHTLPSDSMMTDGCLT